MSYTWSRFEGKYFRCRARHFVAPSPQGRPVLWQAGASEQGRQFAPEFQRELRRGAREFAVREGESISLDLRLTPDL